MNFVGRLGFFGSPAILLREASRSSRQWRTYAARAAFSAILIGVVLLAIGIGTQAIGFFGAPDPGAAGTAGRMGRNLFLGFAAVEILIAMVLAPLTVARAVIEEREEQTLDLVVLTRLTPGQILGAKVTSSLLLLVMITLGALPVLGLVMSLGGVSVYEVLAVTLDTVAALVILGCLGGFFALFTRSQILATGFALAWALPTFVLLPWLYVAGTASLDGATHLSPLYGPAARGWAALLPTLTYIPVVYRVMTIGTNVFAMRAANVSFGRVFGRNVWRIDRWLIEGAVMLVTAFTILPFGVAGSWSLMIAAQNGSVAPGWADLALSVAAHGTVWVWTVLFLSWTSWVYLRLGAEWVIAIESMVGPARQRLPKGMKPKMPLIPANPVLWREARMRRFASFGVGIVVWLIVMWGAFQSMLWLVPGGLLTLGLGNLMIGWLGAVWLATTSIEQERRDGTLELLLTSTLPATKVVVGKMVGVLLTTSPLVVVGVPLVMLGVPHAGMINAFQGNYDTLDWVGLGARGLTVGLWCTVMWVFLTLYAMLVAVRSAKARTAYGLSVGGAIGALVMPWMISVAFPSVWIVQVPMRLLVPLVSLSAPWWEPALSASVLAVGAVFLFMVLCWQLRNWSARVLRSEGG